MSDSAFPAPSWLRYSWQAVFAWMRVFAYHRDPLVEASNWVALLIGTHLPFWPLYVWWSAGEQAFPTALLTMAMTPMFLVIPLISRRAGLLGRIATLLMGIANTVFTIWILGANSGTALFFAPCTALAALSFRRSERWLMLLFTALPLAVFFVLNHAPLVPLHRYDAAAAEGLFVLNLISVSVLGGAFGWLQSDIYQRMEKTSTGIHHGATSYKGALQQEREEALYLNCEARRPIRTMAFSNVPRVDPGESTRRM